MHWKKKEFITKQTYKKLLCTGLSLSPIIANLIMEDLCGYIEEIDKILINFNSWQPRLQFTIEVGGNRIDFLDLTIIIIEKRGLEFDWFHKPTFSGQYLNYLSTHPNPQKKGVITEMIDRAILLSSSKFHYKNMKFIVNTLLHNDYPIDFIFNNINSRLKILFQKLRMKENDVVSDDADEEHPPWFILSYVPPISEKFFMIIKNINVKLSFFSLNKLNKFIKVQKDTKFSNKNVMYKIPCKDCDAAYVGQIGRKLFTRVSEHCNHINSINKNQSVMTDYRLDFNHEFDWESVQILDKKRFLNKRLNSEMFHIYMQKNGLNLKTDTKCMLPY
ncbi:hypothetical protein ALC56_09516 [Trachymyrmex septentrionalis]|uniref:Helix-turn-helix domain-containing protein n=1 Tax=Trachymyrmex septentrionalis TaxID=34720 RepID=A0A151JUB2_9HYME|nr:hypothetical protein ALC56_09516 [Trachymyrmex septentrionalis]